ncbi:MAG: adenylate kinase [Anaerolineae bacterium]|nr:adenylate kinase [Anaerolineae bacterium]
MPTYIVLLGPPGSGKGTQAKIVSEQLGLVHISSGDIFRYNISQQTELGMKAQGFMNRGELVPDDLTIAMIRDRLSQPDCNRGAILDGFPRTPAQAEALDATLAGLGGKVDSVPYIHVSPEILMERLGGRWSCRAQGHVYHEKYHPPKTAGICDIDGSELFQREDDQPATVEKRIKVYLEQTSPLIEYYRKRGLLYEIDGTREIEDVTAEMMKAVGKG